MQSVMARAILVSLFCAPACHALRLEAASWQASNAAAWELYTTSEAEDRAFWSDQFAATESSLLALERAVNASAQAAAPAAKHERKPDAVSQALAHMGGASLSPKNVQDLIPALAMLKGLYEDSKERIATANEREKKSKAHYEAKDTEHKARITKIEARFHNHTLSQEFRANETRDENRLFSYWKGVRERQHRGFHTNLKIQHGMMQKVKTMIDMYEKTISGGKGADQVKKELQQQVAPEVVLLQEQKEIVRFCRSALAEVRVEQQRLRAPWAPNMVNPEGSGGADHA